MPRHFILLGTFTGLFTSIWDQVWLPKPSTAPEKATFLNATSQPIASSVVKNQKASTILGGDIRDFTCGRDHSS